MFLVMSRVKGNFLSNVCQPNLECLFMFVNSFPGVDVVKDELKDGSCIGSAATSASLWKLLQRAVGCFVL